MATFDAHKNLAYSTVLTAPSPATSGTSLVVQSGDGAKFPAVSFNATVWPAGVQPTTANSEIVRVTTIATDTFTITRAQETGAGGPSARSIIIGDQIAAPVTAKTLTDIEALFPTGAAVGTTDTQTLSAKILSDFFMGNLFFTNTAIAESATLLASTDYKVNDSLELAATQSLEVPATSSLEIVRTTSDIEHQSYLGLYDFIESGCIWTADSAGSTLNGTMSEGYVWVGGRRLKVSGVKSRAFTASRDTYVDFKDANDGTATITYTENTNNAAAGAPALPAGSLRNGIIVTAAGSIAAAASINQGQESMIVPIVSSIPYAVTDSLGNLICPRDPNRKVLGYRQIIANPATTTSTSQIQVVGLTAPVIVPTGRKVKITVFTYMVTLSTSPKQSSISIWDGVVGSGTQLNQTNQIVSTSSVGNTMQCSAIVTPTTTSKTYNFGEASDGGGSVTATLTAGATQPAFISVELA